MKRLANLFIDNGALQQTKTRMSITNNSATLNDSTLTNEASFFVVAASDAVVVIEKY